MNETLKKLDRSTWWLHFAGVFVAVNMVWHFMSGRWTIGLINVLLITVLLWALYRNRKIRAKLVCLATMHTTFMQYIVDNFDGCLTVEELKLMQVLEMWTVYEKPKDFPQSYVARKWVIGQTPEATNEVLVGATLEEVRAKLPPGLHCMNRSPEEDPVIVETWL